MSKSTNIVSGLSKNFRGLIFSMVTGNAWDTSTRYMRRRKYRGGKKTKRVRTEEIEQYASMMFFDALLDPIS